MMCLQDAWASCCECTLHAIYSDHCPFWACGTDLSVLVGKVIFFGLRRIVHISIMLWRQ